MAKCPRKNSHVPAGGGQSGLRLVPAGDEQGGLHFAADGTGGLDGTCSENLIVGGFAINNV